MMMSALGFALMGVFVKIAYGQGIPILEIVAARALVSAVISYVDVKRKNISLWGQRKDLLIARGAAGAIALIFVYTALAALPFAEATVLQYLHPMFTALLAVIFLREYLQKNTLVCIVLSVIGLLVMVRPSFIFSDLASGYPVWAIAAAIAGAFGSAVAYVLVRKLNATEDSSVIIFYFPIMALPLSLLMLGDNMVMPQGWAWLSLLLVGVATQVGQVGLTKAMKTASASKATSFSYLQIIFAMVLGMMFFDEIPTLWTVVGAVLIMLGVVINAWPSSHKTATPS
ncbi:MAG: drug/metabolite transporter (DMT)-like permease [Candidatus Endobugula sp.]|jgi:drug/metabolite transporter (DMT)-like permease